MSGNIQPFPFLAAEATRVLEMLYTIMDCGIVVALSSYLMKFHDVCDLSCCSTGSLNFLFDSLGAAVRITAVQFLKKVQ